MVHVFRNRKGEQNLHLENIFLGNNVEGENILFLMIGSYSRC